VVHYKRFDESMVSRAWRQLLRDIRRIDKVHFYVNEGHRTMARQSELVKQLGLWSKSNQHGAAFPSDLAPHIRTGRPDHALDVVGSRGAPGGVPAEFMRAAQRRGVPLSTPVPGEPWHVEVFGLHPSSTLVTYYARRQAEKKAARRLKLAQRVTGVSLKGARFVAGFEGFRERPYKPVEAEPFLTIGYGHYGPGVRPHMVWTRAKALRVLRSDLKSASRIVEAKFPMLTQSQHDAITSAVFNLGPGILDPGRSLGDALRLGHPAKVASALRLYNRGADGKPLAGLVRRREAEADMFLNGTYLKEKS
jgi:lysozyme